MKKVINTTERKFFRQTLELLKHFNPFNKLRNKELDVLGELLYFNYKYSNIDKELRWKLIFDYDTKIKIRDYLQISEAEINVILSSLRKKGILLGRSIILNINITPKDPTIEFIFKINNDESN